MTGLLKKHSPFNFQRSTVGHNLVAVATVRRRPATGPPGARSQRRVGPRSPWGRPSDRLRSAPASVKRHIYFLAAGKPAAIYLRLRRLWFQQFAGDR